MAPSSYEPATKITLQYKLLLICFRVFRGFPKNPLKSPKILSCPLPRCILEAFTISSPVPIPEFWGFLGIFPQKSPIYGLSPSLKFPQSF